MRRGPWLVLPLLLASSVAAQAPTVDQDALLDQYAAFGDDIFFEDYPSLLVLRLSVQGRLQSETPPPSELASFHDMYVALSSIYRINIEADSGSAATIIKALGGLRVLREQEIPSLTHPVLEPMHPMLELAADALAANLVLAAEDAAARIDRTATRLSLLEEALDAAEGTGQALTYSRIDARIQEIRAVYDPDLAEADAAMTQGDQRLAQGWPPYWSLDVVRHYADLIRTQQRLEGAAVLYEKHGENARAQQAIALAEDVNEQTGAVALGMWGVLLGYGAIGMAIGWWASLRIARWAGDHLQARWGDDLALEAPPT